MAGLSKFTGGEAVDEMGKSIDEMGGSASNAIDYLTLSMAKAANQGLNIEQTSKNFAKNIKKRRNRFRDSFGVCGYSRIAPQFCKHSESAGATSSCLAGSKFERFIVQARTAFEL